MYIVAISFVLHLAVFRSVGALLHVGGVQISCLALLLLRFSPFSFIEVHMELVNFIDLCKRTSKNVAQSLFFFPLQCIVDELFELDFFAC